VLSEDVKKQLERQSFHHGCFEKNQRKRTMILQAWETAQQKLAYVGHILRGSGGRNAFVILEGKIKGKR